MRIVVTGAGGFVGRALVPLLAAVHDVVAVDIRLGGMPGIEGNLGEPEVLARAFAGGCDALVHLATVPGGRAEDNPGLGWQVNVEQSMALLQAAIDTGACPRVVFASSIAVLGNDLPAEVDDSTPAAPYLLYGAHKAMMEVWIDTLTRRGSINGVSLRLPGIVARPRSPSGMKSAFMSNVFHACAMRERINLPVSPQAAMWLLSVRQAAHNLALAVASDCRGHINLPALRVTMEELATTIAAATGSDTGLIAYESHPDIEAAFGNLPRLTTAKADAEGFRNDSTVTELVASALETLG